jgi:hypothetical protein
LEFTKDDDIPIQMLLGDKHYSFDNICEEPDAAYISQTNSVILTTFNPSWFNLLDSTCKEDLPIDYYFETFVPYNLLQDPKYLQNHKNFLVINGSVMTYIAQNYLPCFTSKQKAIKSDLCFTKHIRYHMAEVRWSLEYIKIFNEDKPLVKEHYESKLLSALNECCFSFYKHDILMPDSSTKAINIFKQVCLNPINFIDICFNFQDTFIQQNSVIWKQILKQKTTYKKDIQSTKKWIEFIKEYYVFALTIIINVNKTIFEDNLKKVLECINQYDAFKHNFNMYADGYFVMCQELIDNVKSQYEKNVKFLTFNLTLPLIDIHYMLRSWKCTNTPRQWCNVFNAGNIHTTLIRQFLLQNDFFEPIIEPVGDIFNRSLGIRCITFNQTYNLDQHIPKINNQLSNLPSRTTSKLTFLTLWLYWNLLRGMKIKKDSVIQMASIQKIDPTILLEILKDHLSE